MIHHTTQRAVLIIMVIVMCGRSNAQDYESFFNDVDSAIAMQSEAVDSEVAIVQFVGPPEPVVHSLMAPDTLPARQKNISNPSATVKTENLQTVPRTRLTSVMLIGGGIFSVGTTLLCMKLLRKVSSRKKPKRIPVVITSPVIRIDTEENVAPPIHPALHIPAGITRDLVARAFNTIETERLGKKEIFELSTLARKLGVSRGEIDLKIHLQELKERAA